MKHFATTIFAIALFTLTLGIFAKEESAALKSLKEFQDAQVNFDCKKMSFHCTNDVVLTAPDGTVYNQKSFKDLNSRMEKFQKFTKNIADRKYEKALANLEDFLGKKFPTEERKQLLDNNGAELIKTAKNIESNVATFRANMKKVKESAVIEVIAEDSQTALFKATVISAKDSKQKIHYYIVMVYEENMWLVQRSISVMGDK